MTVTDHQAFKISRGFLVSPNNISSPETDLLIVDGLWTTPLHGNLDSPIWLLGRTYASIEVKSDLSPKQISDCMEKCKKLKTGTGSGTTSGARILSPPSQGV
jgi:hypothetical protein